MKNVARAWFGLTIAVAAAAAPAAQPAAPAPAPQRPPAQTAAPTAEEMRESLAAIEAVDERRLLTDRDYAAGVIGHLDRLARPLAGNAAAEALIDTVRLVALVGLQRPEEAGPLIDRVLDRRSADPDQYYGPWLAALSFGDTGRALLVVEAASRNVRGVRWPELRRNLTRQSVSFLFGRMHQNHDEAGRVRLATALFQIGYPGDDAEYGDDLRKIVLDDRLKAGDRAAAAGHAAAISTPSHLLPLLVQTRYDPLFAPDMDRLAALRGALEARDRDTAQALAAAPNDLLRTLDRAQYLRGVGREADALAVLEPHTRDVAATVAAAREGMWVINEAGYALLRLHRNDEAVALMTRLAALPIADNGDLIGPDINFAAMLWQAGRSEEALAHATRLEREAGRFANDYGKMWISSSIVCALARLDRAAEARSQLERMRAQADVNAPALIRAQLCLGDLDSAAAALVRRLESDDPESAIMALQDYSLGDDDAQSNPLHDRYLALRQRPEVRAALARVGRVLTLPLSRTYWGDF